jgi:hypothetical protein
MDCDGVDVSISTMMWLWSNLENDWGFGLTLTQSDESQSLISMQCWLINESNSVS